MILRLWAARIYAGAVLDLVRDGDWSMDDLTPFEHRMLSAFGHTDDGVEKSVPGVVSRFLRWSGTRFGRFVSRFAFVAVWFVFAAQLYIIQFFVGEPASWWLKHPMVQLPWYQNVPGHLIEAAASGEYGWEP